ncbi:N-acetylglucosamine kinase [Kineosporia succinea]|uniref:N-acetylglucosamine kinase-like BadF-type ATPase n=1 Tax=Kineosporia succinea TaxID=84632 RepID=A0ABT9NXK7_9ACTN|nr:BadF/BadG/BcrA/BcrD ATPase family protein [Kineosporia succinea]MDP9825163.1 N-acetylglucosamine kinase-like BadF-type ATPase [Kineosporia succinea]
MTIFLGVDGGGTKTALCLTDENGAVLASLETMSIYRPGHVAQVEEILASALKELGAGEVDAAFFGFPGYGEISAEVPLLDALPARLLGHDRYRCDNDSVCGWAGSLGGADGINVVSGTGSIAYGRRNGTGLRVGGWGEGFGDEGSGHWLGVEGLRLFSRMSDGRVPEGPLLGLLREHLSLAGDLDLVDVVINRWGRDRTPVAALSRVVVEAARAGDPGAQGLLETAGAELALLVQVGRRRLGFAVDEAVPVSYSGGVFSAAEVVDAFTRHLGDGFDLRKPLHSPVIGAALLAREV